MPSQDEHKDTITMVLDGKTVHARRGESVIQVADRHGVYIPRFCYHEKLSVVANCRMCLVEVKGAPKTLPACATTVTQDMQVSTSSKTTLQSQRAVMEFLLINHPLDCPICDQGGECELQDLAVGFGKGVSRFHEGKRSVHDEDLGPLVDTHMTRCIHCTRCVRFGEEEAGSKALGELHRGGDMQIGTYLQHGMHDELSANVIDICPVGALTSKPFQFKGRSWNFVQHQGVGMHDGVGSKLYYHTFAKGYAGKKQLMRVVPRREHPEDIHWIADRDRFSYEGVYSEDRLKAPMIKDAKGAWQIATWQQAIDAVCQNLLPVLSQTPERVAGLLSPSASMQDGYALVAALKAFGCHQVDHRVHVHARGADGGMHQGGMDDFSALQDAHCALLLGSYMRHEQPMAAYWLRKAALKGSGVVCVNPVAYDWHFQPECTELALGDELWLFALECLHYALQKTKKTPPETLARALASCTPRQNAKAWVQRWQSGSRGYVFFGAYAMSLPCWDALYETMRCFVDIMPHGILVPMWPGANSAGLAWAHAQTGSWHHAEASLSATELLQTTQSVYMVQQLEPEIDALDQPIALQSLQQAYTVCLTSYQSPAMRAYANVLLPVGLLPETGGRMVSLTHQVCDVDAYVPAYGQSMPAYRVYETLSAAMGKRIHLPKDAKTWKARLDEAQATYQSSDLRQRSVAMEAPAALQKDALYRVGDPWIYGGDALLRRAASLQKMRVFNQSDRVHMHPDTLAKHGLADTQQVVLQSGSRRCQAGVYARSAMHKQAVWMPSGFTDYAGFSARSGQVDTEKA